MQRNNPEFKTADEIFHEQVAECFKKDPNMHKIKHNNPNKIDTFWEAYNTSRCKTAMLIISILLIAGFIIAELCSIDTKISTYIIIILGYWMGRTSKAKENKLKESGHSE